jgi:hypothetical protein
VDNVDSPGSLSSLFPELPCKTSSLAPVASITKVT